jgi:hypothetical protein
MSFIYFTDNFGDPKPLLYDFDSHVVERLNDHNFINIKRTSVPHTIPKEHVLAILQGTHSHVNKVYAEFVRMKEKAAGDQCFGASKMIYKYIIKLLRDGIATQSVDKTEYLPLLTYDMWSPSVILDKDDRYIALNGRREFFAKPGFQNDPKLDDWGLAPIYIPPVKFILGDMLFDSASSAKHQARIQAAIYYTVEHSALDLKHPWYDNVLVHPPAGQGDLGAAGFARRLALEIEKGVVTNAIGLFNISWLTNKWYIENLIPYETATVAIDLRPRLMRPVGYAGSKETNAPSPMIFWYYGKKVNEFEKAFTPFGYFRPGAHQRT